MVEIQTTSATITKFRATIFVIACLLYLVATWILVPDFFQPAVAFQFPMDAQTANLAYARRDKAILSARIGLVRGDLWTQAAFSFSGNSQTKSNSEYNERARALTIRAVALAPHNSRLWLLLATLNSRFDWLNDRASADLRMSYYTGSNAIRLVPIRLLLAVQAHALADDDFQELVRHDIRIAVLHKSELLPALIAAYNNAPQNGQQFIQKTLSELDPSLLPLIHSTVPPH